MEKDSKYRMKKFAARVIIALLMLAGVSSSLRASGVGYAFSGGGARGYAHIGILKVLEEYGVYPDYISGTSIGAIIGGLYAMGYSAAEIEAITYSTDWANMFRDSYRRGDLYIGQKRWAPYGNLVLEVDSNWKPLLPSSVFIGNNVNLELFTIFSSATAYTDFSKLPIPFSCVATDLISGEPTVFTHGSMMQAIRASLSIPSIMQPFELNDKLYIDGGISQNLPVAQVASMGADRVIGFKVNSNLRSRDKLVHLVDVLDQTINIGMTRNINMAMDNDMLILQPELEGFGTSDYRRIREIIAAGESYARDNIELILKFVPHIDKDKLRNKVPMHSAYKIIDVRCHGNKTVSCAKIQEYLGLIKGVEYTAAQIADACLDAWNSQSFQVIYPVLTRANNGYILEIHVRERQRKLLIPNIAYTTEEGLNAGVMVSLNNVLLKNSSLMTSLTLGGKTEWSMDYVKNFGEFWGSYFRIFPYLSEHKRYYYNNDFSTQASTRALEYGFTSGIGVFANKLAIAEAFIYSAETRHYRDVSSVAGIDTLYVISGFGVKAYHESLDDYVAPRSGLKAGFKMNFSRWRSVSDYIYSRASGSAELFTPVGRYVSVKLGLEIGSYFGADDTNFDPFYFGGSQGYLGFKRYEKSAPLYKLYDLGLVARPARNWFCGFGVQGINYSDIDVWGPDQEVEWAPYASIGYRSPIGPVKMSIAKRRHANANVYLNVGYDFDVFSFSRK